MPFDETTMLGLHMQNLHEAIEANMRTHAYAPLPSPAFDATQCANAFQTLRSASHIGKVVVALPPAILVQGTQPAVLKPSIMTEQHTKFVAGLESLGQQELVQAVERMVLGKVHEVVSGANVSADDPLMESGVDSLAANELQNSIQRELGTAIKLPSTLTFDSPTAAEIAQSIKLSIKDQQLPKDEATKKIPFHHAPNTSLLPNHLGFCEQSHSKQDVSIAAVQCKTPADVHQASSVWASFTSTRDTVAKIPAHRFEQSNAHGALYGHFVNGHHTPGSMLENPYSSALLGVQVLSCSIRSCLT